MTWLHGDPLGSASLATDGSGNKISELRYMPYDSPRIASGNTPTNRQFTGMPRTSYGTISMGSHEYDPVVGRFLSADSIVPDLRNPQSLNRYSYVYNRPLNLVDPTGHWGEKPNKNSACEIFPMFCSGGTDLLEKEQTATTVNETENTGVTIGPDGTAMAQQGTGIRQKVRDAVDNAASKLGLCKGVMAFICSEAARKAAEKAAATAVF